MYVVLIQSKAVAVEKSNWYVCVVICVSFKTVFTLLSLLMVT